MVPGARIELAWGCPRGILSPLRLPISPPGQRLIGGWGRNRTGVRGFAGRYMTTLTPSLNDSFTQHAFGAGNETRTRDPNLGKVVLYH